MMRLGIDLGGTKIEVIALNQYGQSLWRERAATPQGSYSATLEVIKSLVDKAKSMFSLKPDHPIGIGTPGALFYDDANKHFVLKNSNSTVLNGKPFLDDLKLNLGCNVFLENDANCFVLAETLSGAGADLASSPETVFGVILGTGVGGGLVADNRLLSGRHHIAGEWGHNMLPTPSILALPERERNRECYCGRYDCIETYLSGPGLSNSYRLRFEKEINSIDIISGMRTGQIESCSVWHAYVEQLAVSLAQVVNIIDPDLIVLGGGMSLIDEIYPSLPERMKPYVFADHFTTPVLPAKLGDSAGVFGAAWLTG